MNLLCLLKSSLAAGAILVWTSGVAVHAADLQEDFDRLAADLEAFHQFELLRGGSGEPVVFDSDAAGAHGFSADAIELGQQIADQTNEIVNRIAEAQGVGWPHAIDLDMEGRPELKSFLTEATKRSFVQIPTGDQDSEAAPEMETMLLPGARLVCGYYPNPKPARAAPWRNYSFPNPALKLRQLGYHPTPGFAGGGWTRPQTYQPLFCGIGKFRDHALISGNTLREQNYKGSPGGEPNPEIFPPWPYADWPLYVLWWHRTR
jgi:hypothetical protein